MEIIVRDYMDSDLDKVNEILLEAFGVSKGNFKDDNLRELVSVSDSEVSGYLILTKVLNPIKNIYYCLIGTSDKLINYAIEVAKEMGANYLQLTSAPHRIGAHKLYERCGFKKRETDVFRKEIV